MHRVEELKEEDIGTGAGLFKVEKLGEEYFSFFVDCKEPKACSIILRGASRDVLNEVERNLRTRWAWPGTSCTIPGCCPAAARSRWP